MKRPSKERYREIRARMKLVRKSLKRKTLVCRAIAVISIFFLYSCSMENYCSKHFTAQGSSDTIVRDSICYVPHDSLIRIPADSSAITALLACTDENGKLTKDKVKLMQIVNYQAGKRTGIPQIMIRDNYIESKCKVDTMSLVHHWLEKHVNRYVKTSRTTVQKVNVLRWWQTLWIRVGQIVTGILAVILLWYILRKAFPILGTVTKFLK